MRILVDDSKLFHLMVLFDELMGIHNHFVHLAEADAIDFPRLQDEAQRWRGIASEFQETIQKMRMVPVGQFFKRFPRMVKDLSKFTGKQVKLEIEGHNIEVNRVMLGEIAESVQILIRYALDHGIEPPDVRLQQGKPPEGTISLKAYYQGENVYIEISDDGAGLEHQRIKPRTAESRGIAEESFEYKLFNFLVEIMELVLNRIGGGFEIQTALHHGTTVRLCLPRLLKELPGNDRI